MLSSIVDVVQENGKTIGGETFQEAAVPTSLFMVHIIVILIRPFAVLY